MTYIYIGYILHAVIKVGCLVRISAHDVRGRRRVRTSSVARVLWLLPGGWVRREGGGTTFENLPHFRQRSSS